MRPLLFALLSCLIAGNTATAQEPLRVVTTLTVYADLVKTIGGLNVTVSHIVPAKFNPHFIEPRPSDVLNLKRADLFVHTGLDLELWRWPLVDAAGKTDIRPGGSRELDLSRGIPLLEVPDRAVTRAEGDIHLYGNPHYWLDPRNGVRIAQAIASKLAEIDPAHTTEYQGRLQQFLAKLEPKITDWQAQLEPYRDTELVGYHNQWPYLMAFLGLRMTHFLEPKPGLPPTPRGLKSLKDYITDNGLKAIVRSSIFSPRAVRSLAKRSGAQEVLLAHNVGEVPEATDYIAMFDYNLRQLVEVLR